MLILYTRSGCCLCEAAEARLQSAGVPFERRDVDTDPAWQAAYTFRVPVLVHSHNGDEAVLFEGDFAAAALPGT